MIYLTSRYNNGPLVDVNDYRRGTARKAVFRRWPTSVSQFSLYVWREGDRIDLLAQRFYGRADAWWQIMDYNPEVIDPTSIPPGTQIRLPA